MIVVAQGLVDIMREHTLFRQSAHSVEVTIILRKKCFKSIRKEKEKARAVDVSSNRNSEHPPHNFFRCGSEDHMIAKCPRPPKYNEKRRKQVQLNEKGNRACDNGEDNDYHKIYASMARMSCDNERKSVKYGGSSQLTNWILD